MTNELGITITSLAPSTEYQISVCSVTIKAQSSLVSLRVKTASAGNFYCLTLISFLL